MGADTDGDGLVYDRNDQGQNSGVEQPQGGEENE